MKSHNFIRRLFIFAAIGISRFISGIVERLSSTVTKQGTKPSNVVWMGSSLSLFVALSKTKVDKVRGYFSFLRTRQTWIASTS